MKEREKRFSKVDSNRVTGPPLDRYSTPTTMFSSVRTSLARSARPLRQQARQASSKSTPQSTEEVGQKAQQAADKAKEVAGQATQRASQLLGTAQQRVGDALGCESLSLFLTNLSRFPVSLYTHTSTRVNSLQATHLLQRIPQSASLPARGSKTETLIALNS